MSVIGRLDEQVDALLISPLKKRGAHHRADEEATTQRANETTDKDGAVASGKSPATKHDKPSDRKERGPDELPVWLL